MELKFKPGQEVLVTCIIKESRVTMGINDYLVIPKYFGNNKEMVVSEENVIASET